MHLYRDMVHSNLPLLCKVESIMDKKHVVDYAENLILMLGNWCSITVVQDAKQLLIKFLSYLQSYIHSFSITQQTSCCWLLFCVACHLC